MVMYMLTHSDRCADGAEVLTCPGPQVELTLLESYLPAMLSAVEVEAVVVAVSHWGPGGAQRRRSGSLVPSKHGGRARGLTSMPWAPQVIAELNLSGPKAMGQVMKVGLKRAGELGLGRSLRTDGKARGSAAGSGLLACSQA